MAKERRVNREDRRRRRSCRIWKMETHLAVDRIEAAILIKVKYRGKTFAVPQSNVGELKVAIEVATGVPQAMQSLILKGSMLSDGQCPPPGAILMLMVKEMSPVAAAQKDRAYTREEEVRTFLILTIPFPP